MSVCLCVDCELEMMDPRDHMSLRRWGGCLLRFAEDVQLG
jgi:hypothetical protein